MIGYVIKISPTQIFTIYNQQQHKKNSEQDDDEKKNVGSKVKGKVVYICVAFSSRKFDIKTEYWTLEIGSELVAGRGASTSTLNMRIKNLEKDDCIKQAR